MEQLEKDILHVKAGALLQLGMQIGAELQLTKKNDRDQVPPPPPPGERQRSSHDAIVGYATSGADGRIFSRFLL